MQYEFRADGERFVGNRQDLVACVRSLAEVIRINAESKGLSVTFLPPGSDPKNPGPFIFETDSLTDIQESWIRDLASNRALNVIALPVDEPPLPPAA